MREADKLAAQVMVTLGDDEMERQEVVVKHMASREQRSVPLAALVDEVMKDMKA